MKDGEEELTIDQQKVFISNTNFIPHVQVIKLGIFPQAYYYAQDWNAMYIDPSYGESPQVSRVQRAFERYIQFIHSVYTGRCFSLSSSGSLPNGPVAI